MDNDSAPSHVQALCRQARELTAQGLLPAALACYRQAEQIAPNDARLLHDYAQLCARTGDWKTATALLRRVVDSRPDSGLEGLLGTSLARLGRDEDAVAYLRKHLRGHPGDDKAWLVLAQCFVRLQQWTSALQCAAEADRLAPSERAMDLALECLSTLGMADDVAACLEEARQRYPDSEAIRAHYGVHQHRLGNIREGLRYQAEIRRRFSPQRPGDHRIAESRWQGEHFDGLLLVVPEQGVGEEILGSSFFPLLARHGQRAVIECDPRLAPVFSRSFPALRFLPRHPDNAARLAADGTLVRRIKTLDLVQLLGEDEAFVQPERWLFPDAGRVAEIRARYRRLWPGRRRVGLSWSSVREINNRHWKSVPLESLLPVLQLPGIVALDLQYGSSEEERQIPVRHGLPPLVRDPEIDPMQDLDGLLAQLFALDAVVTISNTTTHLAGAAGIHADVILPPAPPVYVYWCYDGERTPMYPSLHLWRPQHFGNLDALAGQLARHLAERMADSKSAG